MAFSHTRAAFLSSGIIFVGCTAGAQEVVTVLDPIVLGYGGSEKVATETPQAVTVIDQEEIDRQQATTVGELLGNAPGVQAIGSGRILGESYNIRGVGGRTSTDESRIIVTLDGATKFYEQYRMGSVFLDPEVVKRVEVLRGPASSTLYGTGAIGGVINFETKDPSDFLDSTKNALRFKGSYGSNGNEGGASLIYATEPTEGAGFLFALNKRQADNYEDGAGDEIGGSEYDATSLLLKGKFDLTNNQSITASYVRLWGEWDDTAYDQTGDISFFGTVDRDILDQTLTLKYENESDSPLLNLDVSLSYSDSSNEQTDSSFGCSPFGSPLFCDTEYAYRTLSLNVANDMTFSGSNWDGFVTVGSTISRQERKASVFDPLSPTDSFGFHPEGEDRRFAIYSQGEFTFGEKLTLFPGLRIENARQSADGIDDVDETFISPKLAVLYQINDSVGVFGSIARTERAATIDEVFSVSPTDEPSLNLKPETGTSYEIGATASFYDVFTEGDGMVFKATLFYSEVENLIVRDNQNPVVTPYYTNLPGISETEGFELEGAYESERVFGRMALSMVEGDGDNGYPRSTIPADNLHLTLGGKNDPLGLRYGWTGHFYEKIKYSATDDNPGYSTHDLFFEWTAQKGMAKGIRVGLIAKNVFDKDYQNSLAGTKGAGRSLDLTIGKVFEF